MSIFDILNLLGGLSIFLFGMHIMGQALERRAGDKLKSILSRLTSNKFTAFLTGVIITAIVQSSSATTVMVVGFVNSGLMALSQAINLIMGANVGTTVTAWILSLSGISSDSLFMQLLKPTSFTPVLALIGMIYYVFLKNVKKKDTGLVLLGFATLMFGMNMMSKAVSGLADVPEFRSILLMFESPILGVLAGAILTAIIQSSSASVGILQVLSSTGSLSMGMAIPIIMGQNIGTCFTALLSSMGTNKNAKRAAFIHLSFNIIGTGVCLILFYIAKAFFHLPFLSDTASVFDIAIVHTCFNIFCTLLLFPMSSLLEAIVCKLVPDKKGSEIKIELDERLFATPTIALEQANKLTKKMARDAIEAIRLSFKQLKIYSSEEAERILALEEMTDHLEDLLGTYLVKLSSIQISAEDSENAAKLLRLIGEFERIADYATNILDSAKELKDKGMQFSDEAVKELDVMIAANEEILSLSFAAFDKDDLQSALCVEPLEQVIDKLKDEMRMAHIKRLQKGACSVDNGFVWSDLITSLERCSDHCSNIAGCVMDMSKHSMNLHKSLRTMRTSSRSFQQKFEQYNEKYSLIKSE